MGPYLTTDYRKIQECLEDSLVRLECLKECHLQEFQVLPDFVFPLEKALVQALESVQQVLAQQSAQVLAQRLVQESVQQLVRAEELVEVLEPWVQESE